MQQKQERLWPWLVMAVTIAALDQFSKKVASELLSEGSVQGGFFFLELAKNEGMSFGLDSIIDGGSMLILWINMMLWMVMLAAMPLVKESWTACCGAAMMLGGGLGNMIDRLSSGGVIDFLGFATPWGGLIINLADIWIIFGATALGIDLFYYCNALGLLEQACAKESEEERKKDGEGH